MVATRTAMSIEDFLAGDWPKNTQLIDGEVVMNDPSFRHQRVTFRIAEALAAWTRSGKGWGEAGFGGNWTLAPGQAYLPDVWWASEEARPGADAVRSDTPPGLVAEVRSPGTWTFDVGRKRTVYEQAGVGELWLVDTPARTVLVHRRSAPDVPSFDVSTEVGPGQALTTPLFDGFNLAVDDLFRD